MLRFLVGVLIGWCLCTLATGSEEAIAELPGRVIGYTAIGVAAGIVILLGGIAFVLWLAVTSENNPRY